MAPVIEVARVALRFDYSLKAEIEEGRGNEGAVMGGVRPQS